MHQKIHRLLGKKNRNFKKMTHKIPSEHMALAGF